MLSLGRENGRDDVRRANLGTTVLVALTLLAGCGTPRLLMRSASSREIPPPDQGRARVVLAIPGAHRDVVSVVDERGQYLGQLGARTYFSVSVAPGTRRFYAMVGSSAYVVGGPVEAGRTYWVTGEDSAMRPFRWIAWAPACGADPMARLADARAIENDPQADGGALARQLGNVPQRILEADRELAGLSDAERTLRTLAAPACEAGGESADAPVSEPAPSQAQPAAAE